MRSFLFSLTAVAAAHCLHGPAITSAFTSHPSGVHTRSSTTSLSSTAPAAAASTTSAPPVKVSDPNHPLIQLTNEYIYTKSGFYGPYDESVFSDEFVFRGPYIGPLNKKDYLDTMDTFGIYKAIPDINPNAFGFTIDPLNENKVWFMVRNTGTFTGEPGLGLGVTHFPPNGAELKGCPETFSMEFDKDNKIKYLTVGYVADRFEGNTKGKGAAVGIFNAIGFPFPSPGPLLSFMQWFATEVFNVGASSYSTKDIPEWWTSEEKASEGYL